MRILTFLILCISTLAASMGVGIIIPIFPIYLESLGISGIMLGVVFAAFFPSFILMSPIIGKISDKIGYKPVIIIGLGVHIPAALLIVAATTASQLILIRLLEGMLTVMVFAAAMAYAGTIASSKDQEGLYMGLFSAFFLIGNGFGPLVGGYFADHYNINMPFYVMAGLLAVAFVLVLFFVPNQKSPMEMENNNTPENKNAIQKALQSNLFKGMILFGFIIAVSQNGLMILLPIRAQAEQFTAYQIGILTSTIFICAGIMLPLFGLLCEKYNKAFFLTTSVLLVGIIMAFVPVISGFSTFFILAMLVGVGLAIGLPAANVVMIKELENCGMGLGYGFGLFNLALGLGFTVGPVLCGFVMDRFGINPAISSISVLLIVTSFVIYMFSKDMKNI